MRKQCLLREKLATQVAKHIIQKKKYCELETYVKKFLERFYVTFIRDIAILFVYEGYSFSRNEKEYTNFCNDVEKLIIEMERPD